VALALDFATWERLRDEGLTEKQAARAMRDAVLASTA
jgi:hypothetical protein